MFTLPFLMSSPENEIPPGSKIFRIYNLKNAFTSGSMAEMDLTAESTAIPA